MVTVGDQSDSWAMSEAEFWTVHQGDARNLDSLLNEAARRRCDEKVPFLQTTITSPPYATLVDYGSENQIGFQQSYDEYLRSCRDVFDSVFRWTKDTGSMWVVADSLIDRKAAKGVVPRLVPLPFDLAKEAESAGWVLREVVIWRKDRTRPWSHHGKLRNGFEYVLFFVKSDKFIFEVDRLRDTANLKSWWVKYPERHNPWGMTPENVWEIPVPVQGSWDKRAFRHACPFPEELVRRMILLSSHEGDVIFDPFAGSGSVIDGARRQGRSGLGVELNPTYVEIFQSAERVYPRKTPEASSVGVMTQRLLELRVLKYPKEMVKQILRAGVTTEQVRAVLLCIESINYEPARSGYAEIVCIIVVPDNLPEGEKDDILRLAREVGSKAPLSKYGLIVDYETTTVSEVGSKISNPEVSIYTRGQTWHADITIQSKNASEWLQKRGVPTVVPILSSLFVRQSLEEAG